MKGKRTFWRMFFLAELAGSGGSPERFCRIAQHASCLLCPYSRCIPVFLLHPLFFPVRWIREGIWGRYGRYRGRIWVLVLVQVQGKENGNGSGRVHPVFLCHPLSFLLRMHPLPFATATASATVIAFASATVPPVGSSFLLWYSLSFLCLLSSSLYPPCLSPASSHSLSHSLILPCGYPFVIVNNNPPTPLV